MIVPGALRGCSYLNHNQEADGEQEEEEALHFARILVVAFGDEHRAVCRPLLAWLLLNQGGGVEGRGRTAC